MFNAITAAVARLFAASEGGEVNRPVLDRAHAALVANLSAAR